MIKTYCLRLFIFFALISLLLVNACSWITNQTNTVNNHKYGDISWYVSKNTLGSKFLAPDVWLKWSETNQFEHQYTFPSNYYTYNICSPEKSTNSTNNYYYPSYPFLCYDSAIDYTNPLKNISTDFHDISTNFEKITDKYLENKNWYDPEYLAPFITGIVVAIVSALLAFFSTLILKKFVKSEEGLVKIFKYLRDFAIVVIIGCSLAISLGILVKGCSVYSNSLINNRLNTIETQIDKQNNLLKDLSINHKSLLQKIGELELILKVPDGDNTNSELTIRLLKIQKELEDIKSRQNNLMDNLLKYHELVVQKLIDSTSKLCKSCDSYPLERNAKIFIPLIEIPILLIVALTCYLYTRHTRRMSDLQIFFEYNKRLENILLQFPKEIFSKNIQLASLINDQERVLNNMRAFYDLVIEMNHLKKSKIISVNLCNIWKSKILTYTSRQAFKEAWSQLKYYQIYTYDDKKLIDDLKV